MQRLDDQISDVASKMDNLAISVQADKAQIIDAIDSAAQPIKTVTDYVDAKEMDEVLRWYSTVPCQSTHDKVHEHIVEGTGHWLLNHPFVTRWISSKSSSLLWLHGTMGMGKSSLVSIVIEHLQSLANPTTSPPPAFFYFVRGSEQTSDRHMLATAARQLANLNKGQQLLRKAKSIQVKHARNGVENASDLPSKKLGDIVLDMTAEYPAVWLIIDALDECDDAVDVLDNLKRIMDESSVPVKVFISSREHHELESLYKEYDNINVHDGRLSGDLAAFVDAKMNELIRKRKLLGSIAGRRDKDDLSGKIRESIVGRADGMYVTSPWAM